jgi:glycosyltransferase involved in cell wall biosynthesis
MRGTGVKVALVHDWLTGMRGGEKCLEVFCELFPDADIFTLIHVPGRVAPRIEQHRIITSFLQDLPGRERWYRYYLPLMPAAVEALDLSPYDVVLSSSHCVAKGVIPRPDALHVSYLHTPMRYAWDLWPQYFPPRGWVSRYVLPVLLNRLRTWDTVSTHRVDHLVANSRFVAQRIARYYRREATVIHPPVDTAWFTPVPGAGAGPVPMRNFYLMVTALVPNKRVDLAIEAFNHLRRPLKIIGSGPLETPLRRLAGPTIEMLGWCSDEVLRQAYATCKAVVFPSQEDFGIVPLEANAAGRPVIALAQGGSLETVVPANTDGQAWRPLQALPHERAVPPTGVFFFQPSAPALAEAVRFFEAHEAVFDPTALRQHALPFDRQRFKQRMSQFLDAAWAAHGDPASRNGTPLTGARFPDA